MQSLEDGSEHMLIRNCLLFLLSYSPDNKPNPWRLMNSQRYHCLGVRGKRVLGVDFSVDFNFSSFLNELRFLQSSSNDMCFDIAPCFFQGAYNLSNCCGTIVSQPPDYPVRLNAILTPLLCPTPSHIQWSSVLVYRC